MRIVTRTEAGLAAPRKAIPPGPSTRKRLFLHHSVTPLSSDPLADWRKVQAAAFGRGFADISYTWGVHLPSRCVLAGRSPHVVGAHTEGFNDTAHAIVLIGNYENDSPMNLGVIGELRSELVGAGWLTPDHTFQPHRAVQQTACPGSKIVARWADITTNQGDDMPLNDDDKGFIHGTVQGLVGTIEGHLAAEIRAVGERVDQLSTAGVDLDALAAKVADLLAERLKD